MQKRLKPVFFANAGTRPPPPFPAPHTTPAPPPRQKGLTSNNTHVHYGIYLNIGLDKIFFFNPKVLIFFLFLHKTYVVGTHKKRLIEALLMSIHNICYHGDKKYITEVSCQNGPSQNVPKSKRPQIGQNGPKCSCKLVKTAPKNGPKNGLKFDLGF